ncbi:MAG TPA: hypothetical protein VJB14_18325 [Planctomycetota bacterium]|nr:hypothetical protein [Planctomycetota bacterium]
MSANVQVRFKEARTKGVERVKQREIHSPGRLQYVRFPSALPALLLLGCPQAPGTSHAPLAATVPDQRLKVVWNEPAEVHVSAWECRSKVDSTAGRNRCEIVPAGTVKVATRRLLLIDVDGEERTVYHPDPNDQPETRAALCPRHRDRPAARLLREARLLLAAADLLWNEESEASIHAYQRLLADYPEFLHLLGSPIRIRKRAEQGD